METLRRVGFLAVVAALAAWLPGQAAAQQGSVSVDVHGGLSFPGGQLSEIQGPGPNAGLDVRYWLTDRVAVMGGGSVDLMSGADASELVVPTTGGLTPFLPAVDAPDVTFINYFGGVAFQLTPPGETAWDVEVDLGVGATTWDSDDFPEEVPEEFDIDEDGQLETFGAEKFTDLSLHPGVKVGYQVNERLNIFARGRGNFAFPDEVDTQRFAIFDEDIDGRGFEDFWNIPLSLGVNLTF
jgi:hypothetical protein